MLGEAYEIKESREWERLRYIAYITMVTSINDMSGKPYFKNIKKPTDIFSLPQDSKATGKVYKIDKERQAKAVARHKLIMANK